MMAPVSRSQMSPNGSTMTLANGASRRACCGGVVIGGDQPHRLTLAAGMDRVGERRDFRLRGGKVVFPQVGIARKTDPDRCMRRPFGKGRLGHGGA